MTMTMTDTPIRAVTSSKTDALEFKNEKISRSGQAEFGQVMSDLMANGPAETRAETASAQALDALAAPAQGQSLAEAGLGLPGLLGTVGGDFLKAVHWGPHLNIITPETPAPDAHSLEAFARSQGLDENAVQWLMGSTSPAHSGGTGTIFAGLSLTSHTGPAAAVGGLTPGAHWPEGMPAGLHTGLALAGDPLLASAASLPGTSTAPIAPTAPAVATAPAVPTGPASLTVGTGNPQTSGTATLTELQLNPIALTSAALWAMGQNTEKARIDVAATYDSATQASAVALQLLAPAGAPTALWMLRQGLSTPVVKEGATPKTSIALSEIDFSQEATPELLNSLARDGDAVPGEQPTPLSGHNPHKSEAGGAHAKANSDAADNLATADGSATQRSEKVLQLAEKMGRAVGQRILSEIEKGQWHLKLSLRPATLGHIEVEMRMRSGEMDAIFTAPQALTRELLQEGMAKLRDTLSQMGMNVASFQVGDGQTPQGGGNSTPGQMSKSAKPENNDATPTAPVVANAPRVKMGQDGWDVMV